MPDDWPAQAADKIEQVVGKVRDTTTGPALKASQYAVYGIVAGMLGTVAAVLGLILLVRVLDIVLPDSVWLPYLVLGVLFTGIGTWCWRQRFPR
jgi:hypothetical protein